MADDCARAHVAIITYHRGEVALFVFQLESAVTRNEFHLKREGAMVSAAFAATTAVYSVSSTQRDGSWAICGAMDVWEKVFVCANAAKGELSPRE